MKRILFSFAILFFLLFTNIQSASAQSELFFGQDHFYTVIFRGNGEAIVYSKMAFTNNDEKPLTEFSFQVPKVTPTEMVIYQMKLDKICRQYDYSSPGSPICLSYSEPDYTEPYYNYENINNQTKYEKIAFTKIGGLYNLTLSTPVQTGKSTAIILAFAAKGYVKESFGLFNFNFETLKVPARIKTLKVTVDVDSDLLLKGKKATVNYNTTSMGVNSIVGPLAIESRNLDKTVNEIGAYGPLMKEATNLSPNESFNVKGEYSASWLGLYSGAIFLTILIILGIFTSIYLLIKFLIKLGKQTKQTTYEAKTFNQPNSQEKSSTGSMFMLSTLTGLFSMILVVLLTFLLQFISTSNVSNIPYREPNFLVLFFIFIFLLYILTILGPAITLAIKYGWKALILSLVAEFFWFLIFLIAYYAFFQTGLTTNVFKGGVQIQPLTNPTLK